MGRLTGSQWFVIALVAVLAAFAWLGYQRLMMPYAVEREDNLALSQIVTTTFGKASALKVGTLSGTVQATAADTRAGGMLQSDSVIRAPYSVDYFVDVSKLTLADYAYEPGEQVLRIRVPEVTVARANVDEGAMTVRRRGVFITRDAMDTMNRTASRRAAGIAQKSAERPEMLAKARANARAVLAGLLRAPLTATGRDKVKVQVIFPTDGGPSNERWDESRSLDAVLGKR